MRSKSPRRILDLLGYEYKEPQLLRILLHSGFWTENRGKPERYGERDTYVLRL